MSQSIKSIVVSRIDKLVSRESLSLVVCVVAFLENALPAEWLAAVSAVLIAGLSIEKTVRGVWDAKLAIQNAQAPETESASVVDTQDQVSVSP